MNIEKFKHQHLEIHLAIVSLRDLAKGGIAANAPEIARHIISMSSLIKLHLAVENTALYPALQASGDPAVARLGAKFQHEMEDIAATYVAFARRWNNVGNISKEPEEFRADANRVLKVLHGRMRQEDTDFYPVIEAVAVR